MYRCDRARERSTNLCLISPLSQSMLHGYLCHLLTLPFLHRSGVRGRCAGHTRYAVRLILSRNTVMICGARCAALGFTGHPFGECRVFTLSKERKANGFESLTCIAMIPVPCLVPDAKHCFPKTRVPNINSCESCGCAQRSLLLVVASACQSQNKHATDFRRTMFSR